jgi:hypothetical protein
MFLGQGTFVFFELWWSRQYKSFYQHNYALIFVFQTIVFIICCRYRGQDIVCANWPHHLRSFLFWFNIFLIFLLFFVWRILSPWPFVTDQHTFFIYDIRIFRSLSFYWFRWTLLWELNPEYVTWNICYLFQRLFLLFIRIWLIDIIFIVVYKFHFINIKKENYTEKIKNEE